MTLPPLLIDDLKSPTEILLTSTQRARMEHELAIGINRLLFNNYERRGQSAPN